MIKYYSIVSQIFSFYTYVKRLDFYFVSTHVLYVICILLAIRITEMTQEVMTVLKQ